MRKALRKFSSWGGIICQKEKGEGNLPTSIYFLLDKTALINSPNSVVSIDGVRKYSFQFIVNFSEKDVCNPIPDK